MDELEDFLKTVSELGRIQEAMANVSKSDDADWRRELIDLRRSLQAQITQVALAISRCRAISADDELGSAMNKALSQMRSALALHQANWPAVSIDPSDSEYIRSIGSVRAANRAFADLARRVFPPRNGSPSNQSGRRPE